MNDINRHPDPELIAAFVEGSLDDKAMKALTAHIDKCDACLLEMKDLTMFLRQKERLVPFDRRVGWWLAAAAAAVLVIGGALLVRRPAAKSASLVAALAGAAPTSERTLEPRLTGFRWARLHDPLRDETPRPDPQQLKLTGVAGDVLEKTAKDKSLEGRHAAGLANLIIARSDDAIRSLQAATEQSPYDPAAWSDLSAAYYVSAMRNDRPADLPQALAAAERALRIAPDYAEARFNRALVLERLGLTRQAKEAWQQYLAQDRSPNGWSAEARRHLQLLNGTTRNEEFRNALPQLEAAADAGNSASVRVFLDRFREQTRKSCEIEVLGAWGRAVLTGDPAAARAKLRLAEMVGRALGEASGEEMLLHSVAILRQAAGTRRELLLAEGHRLLREANQLKNERRSSAAEPVAVRAAATLQEAGSPMAFVARALQASTVYDAKRTSEAIALLERIGEEIRGSKYIALDAQVSRLLGLSHANRGEWSQAIASFEHAVRQNVILGDRASEAFVHNMLAETYDRLFDFDRAWKERVAAFPVLSSEASGNRLCVALSGVIDSELRRGNIDSAVSFIDLTLDEGRVAPSLPAINDAYVRRALIHAARGDRVAADQAIRDARATVRSIEDAPTRDRAAAYVAIGAASIIAADAPASALRELAFAESVYRARGEEAELPLVFLERGRALRAAGDAEGSLRATDQALAAIDRQRLSMRDLELRGGIFDAAEGLLDNGIELLLERGENEKAFAYVEHARGRALAEQIAVGGGGDIARVASVPEIQAALPLGIVVIELAVLRDRVVAFALTRSDFQVSSRAVARRELAQEVTAFVDATANGETDGGWRQRAERLYTLLLSDSLAGRGERTVIIVPDRFLQSVPYAALWNPAASAYLVEKRVVRLAPRASFLATRPAPSRSGGRVLVVGDPRINSTTVERLPQAAEEARTVAGIYRGSSLLTGQGATRKAFVEQAIGAWLIHFAGHGTADGGAGTGGAILFAGQQHPSRLHAHEIAAMNLHEVSLVVLAACDSLVGRGEHVEWTPTLAHSFLAAGAGAVVGTLWPVRDSVSAEFFAIFHREIAGGAAPDAALQETQLTMIRSSDTRLRDPAAWAGVELIGR